MEDVVLEVNGLATGGNPSVAPSGSLRKAENCMVVRPGCIEQRPGFARVADLDAEVASNYVYTIIDYKKDSTDGQLLLYGTTPTSMTNYIWGDGTTFMPADFAEVNPPDIGFANPWGVTARANLYLPSLKNGLYKATSPGSTGYRVQTVPPSGANNAITVALVNSVEPSDNWLPSGNATAYKVVIRKVDSNGVITRSAPTFFIATLLGAGGARCTDVTVYLSNTDIASGDTVEIYRTVSAVLVTAGDYGELSADFFLAASKTYSSGTSITVRDTTSDDNLGAELYTNESQEGPAAINWPPPSGTTGAFFRDCLWVGNTNDQPFWTRTGKYFRGAVAAAVPNDAFKYDTRVWTRTLGSDIISVTTGTVANLHIGMVLSNFASDPISGVPTATGFTAGTYITALTDGPTGVRVTVSSAYTGATGNLDIIMRDFFEIAVGSVSTRVYAGNTTSGNSITMPPSGSYSGAFGATLITGLNNGLLTTEFHGSLVTDMNQNNPDIGFALWLEDQTSATYQQPVIIQTSAPDAFAPAIQKNAAGWGYEVDYSFVGKNKVSFSKPREPEHWNLANYIALGDENARVIRLVALEDSLIVFKEDGVFRIQGSFPGWYVDTVDTETKLCTPESVCVLDNVCYAWTSRGVVAVTEYDIQLLSVPALAPETVALGGTSTDLVYAARSYTPGITVGKGSYAVAIPHRGLVCFAVSADRTDARSDVWWVFNPALGAWTTWQLTSRCAAYKESESVLMIEAGDKSSRTFEVRQEKYAVTGPDTYDDSHALGNLTATTSIVIATSATDGWIPAVGDLVYGTVYAYVTAVVTGGGNYTISLSRSIAASASAVFAYESIPVKMRWNQQGIRGPFSPAMWREFETQWFDLQQVSEVAPKYTARFYGSGTTMSSDMVSNWTGRSGGVTAIQSGIGQSVIDRISVHRSVARSPVIAPELEFVLPLTRWRLGASMLNGAKGNTARGVRR